MSNLAGCKLSSECSCTKCVEIDWDAPCVNCDLPQRECCGCHEGEHYDYCETGIAEARFFNERDKFLQRRKQFREFDAGLWRNWASES